ncbi:glycosyltransferase family 4 protein [Variovorax sp. Varisp36]|uniref:glycosyltransferase family 4 protein n=1 Tax=Variovorax sp. Varisp36 TaxID=3243031 RepID=UPI0039A6EDC1
MVSRVAHLSTAHGRREVRVHLKECNSLAAAGYEVHYIVADGLGDERVGAVQVHDIGASQGRFQRMLIRPWKMLWAARKLRARLYHFHDPEILLIALFLLIGGAKVIYDSHEDVPRSLLSRAWIPKLTRRILSFIFEAFENFVARRISAVVGATPHIAARFARLNKRAVDINNYPLCSEIEKMVDRKGNERTVCYLGGIGRVRGIEEMIRALEHTDAKLILAGPFESAETELAMRALPGWGKVDYRGKVSRASVREIMAASSAGLVLFHPEPNHVDAQPNKLFEYMSAGLPVIGSDFPLWRNLIKENDCGLCVDPLNPAEIASAINSLIDDSKRAARLGQNGRHIVLTKCNWSVEEGKLFNLYESLLGM